jgi:hypothetical protein
VISTAARLRQSAALAWTLLALTAPAAAQTETETATINASISTIAKLSLSAASVSFADADPDAVPQVTASGGPLSITAKARATNGAQVLLTVRASNNLRSGVNTIAASALTWTTTGTGFQAGTMSQTAQVTVGRWTGSGVRTGTQTLRFQNLWTYRTGTYTTSLTYTLSAP